MGQIRKSRVVCIRFNHLHCVFCYIQPTLRGDINTSHLFYQFSAWISTALFSWFYKQHTSFHRKRNIILLDVSRLNFDIYYNLVYQIVDLLLRLNHWYKELNNQVSHCKSVKQPLSLMLVLQVEENPLHLSYFFLLRYCGVLHI